MYGHTYGYLPGIFMKVSASLSNAVVPRYRLFSSTCNISESQNNSKMSMPSKTFKKQMHLCASGLLPIIRRFNPDHILTCKPEILAMAEVGWKSSVCKISNGIEALACMLAGPSSCDEIWFGESFDITRQWYPEDTGEMAPPLIAMFHYNMHITRLSRVHF